MEQRLKNRVERLANTSLFFQQTRLRWESFPAVSKRINHFLTEQGKLPTPPPDADRGETVTTGARAAAKDGKDEARANLALHLVPVAASLGLWLRDPDNQPADPLQAEAQRALAARLNIRQPSRLTTMATLALLGLAQVTLDALVLVPAKDLEDFDLSADDTADFEKAAGLFGLRRNAPGDAARNLREDATSLDEKLDVLEAYAEDELKMAVDTRRRKDSGFVKGFKDAYKLIDKRGARKTPKAKKAGKGDAQQAPGTTPAPATDGQ